MRALPPDLPLANKKTVVIEIPQREEIITPIEEGRRDGCGKSRSGQCYEQ